MVGGGLYRRKHVLAPPAEPVVAGGRSRCCPMVEPEVSQQDRLMAALMAKGGEDSADAEPAGHGGGDAVADGLETEEIVEEVGSEIAAEILGGYSENCDESGSGSGIKGFGFGDDADEIDYSDM